MASTPAPQSGIEIMRSFVPASPLVAALGIELTDIAEDYATLRLPFAERNTTIGDVVHGGAIATLADVATMAAAWAGAEPPLDLRGVTVSLTVAFTDTARSEDLIATSRVVRRGRSLCHCDVEVTGADGRVVARALGTYKLG